MTTIPVKKLLAMVLALLLVAAAAGCKGKPADLLSSATFEESGGDQSDIDVSETGQLGSDDESTAQTVSNGAGSTSSSNSAVTVTPPEKTVQMKIGSVWGNVEYNRPAGFSAQSDAYTKKIAEILTKYNVQLKIETITSTSIDIIARAIQAGDVPYDMMEMHMVDARNLAMAGALYDQKSIRTLNLSAPQFAANKAIMEDVTFNNKIYASRHGFPINVVNGVFINTDLLKKYNQPDVMALYKQKQWTFQRFRDICKAVSRDTNGDSQNDIWGMAASSGVEGLALSANAGGTVTRRANGEYFVNMTSQAGIHAYEWLRELYHTDGSFYRATSPSDGYKMFQDGNAAFLPGGLIEYVSFSNACDFDFIFLPFPIGPDQTEHIIGAYDDKVFCMPKTIKNADLLGQVYAELSTIDLDGVYRKQLKNGGFEDSALDVIMTLHKYLSPEFIGGIKLPFNDNMRNSIYSQNGSPATVLNSVKTQFDKAVKDFYANVKG